MGNIFDLLRETDIAADEAGKARLENDPTVQSFIETLSIKGAWTTIDGLFDEETEDPPKIVAGSHPVPGGRREEILNRAIDAAPEGTVGLLGDLLALRGSLPAGARREEGMKWIRELLARDIHQGEEAAMAYCSNCDTFRPQGDQSGGEECPTCRAPQWVVTKATLPQPVFDTVDEDFHLELYAKRSLERAGFGVFKVDTSSGSAATSLRFPIGGQKPEFDVLAKAKTSLVFVECKNTNLRPNDIDKRRARGEALIDFLKERLEWTPRPWYVFVSTESVDRDAANLNDTTDNVVLFGRHDLPALHERFRDMRENWLG